MEVTRSWKLETIHKPLTTQVTSNLSPSITYTHTHTHTHTRTVYENLASEVSSPYESIP